MKRLSQCSAFVTHTIGLPCHLSICARISIITIISFDTSCAARKRFYSLCRWFLDRFSYGKVALRRLKSDWKKMAGESLVRNGERNKKRHNALKFLSKAFHFVIQSVTSLRVHSYPYQISEMPKDFTVALHLSISRCFSCLGRYQTWKSGPQRRWLIRKLCSGSKRKSQIRLNHHRPQQK